jgi:hypothetical protein
MYMYIGFWWENRKERDHGGGGSPYVYIMLGGRVITKLENSDHMKSFQAFIKWDFKLRKAKIIVL